MKISTKGRYALRVMLDVAAHNTGEYIKVKDISSRQEISDKYLEQIISLLSKAGFLRSTRGAQGGYKLAKDPSYYTVGMILRTTEGSLAPVSCLDVPEGESPLCDRYDSCDTVYVWKKLKNAIDDVVDSITLEDLLERQRSREDGGYMI